MSSSDGNDRDGKVTGFAMRNISNDQQRMISFRAKSNSDDDAVERNYKLIVGKVLNGRGTIVVTKKDPLPELLSIHVKEADRKYIYDNAEVVKSFAIKPYTDVTLLATLVRKMPLSVAEDLADSSEFSFGNLWFLVPPSDTDIHESVEHIIDDIDKLSSYTDSELPILWHEALDSPAIHDGLEMFWFKPNEDICEKEIKPLFEN